MFNVSAGATRRLAQNLLLVFALTAGPAFAHSNDPVDPAALAQARADFAACGRRLTANEKYAARPRRAAHAPDFGRTELRLMNEVLRPVTRMIRAEVTRLDADQIVRDARRAAPTATVSLSRTDRARMKFVPDADDAYLGRVWWNVETPIRAAFTIHNEAMMARLTRAVTMLHHYHHAMKASFAPIVADGGDVLDHHSYSRRDLSEILDFAEITILHAVALLTASPVEGFTAEQVLARITAPYRRRQSLMNHLSLTAPPGFVPEMGQFFYPAGTLTVVNGDLKFSEKFEALMARRREAFTRRPAHAYESGLGCPVGHRARGEPQTGVQDILDAVMHIYRALPSTSDF